MTRTASTTPSTHDGRVFPTSTARCRGHVTPSQAVAAIVDNRTQKLEAELSQTRQELAEMKAMLQLLVDKGEERHGLLRRLID